jgi:indole-3-glycerol phosphate synthase
MKRNWTLVAEVKTRSPFGFVNDKSWDELFEIANEYGDVVSIHTDPRWGGSFELIEKARGLTSKPILAKGIHAKDSDIEQAIKAGADYVLVVGRMPKVHLGKCWLEPNTLAELSQYPREVKVVWNQRDLKDGSKKKETFEEARTVWPGWLCQASLVKTVADVDPAVDAVLVGEHLLGFVESFR